jgi:hypothetical protein
MLTTINTQHGKQHILLLWFLSREKTKLKRTISQKVSNLFPNNTAQLMFAFVVLLLSSHTQIITGDPESQVFFFYLFLLLLMNENTLSQICVFFLTS